MSKQYKRRRNDDEWYVPQKKHKPLEALTDNLGHYMRSINNYEVTIATGPSGVGKTYTATVIAAEKLLTNEIDRLYITRPGVEAGEKWGHLPGELISEKYAPFLDPVMDALQERINEGTIYEFIEKKIIVPAPLAFMRGKSLKNCFVIFDEAQNSTAVQMKMFLTRIGEGATVVINGDPEQIDLPPKEKSGLIDAIYVLQGLERINHIRFTDEDIVRSGLVKDIIVAYRNAHKQREN